MARVHLFEFGDKTWVPKILRDYQTDFLEFGANQFDTYRPVMDLLEKGVALSSNQEVLDMGSGGGGGWPKIIENFKKQGKKIKVKFTDFDPNLNAFNKMKKRFPEVVDYEEQSVDAQNVPSHLKGFRTMFLSFHHMRPITAQRILQNAVDSGEPIGVFELQDRSPLSLLFMFIFAPINIILTAPFIKPFSVGRIFFTLLFPILPLITWWDGVVSNLRTYHEHELWAMVEKLEGGTAYEWEIGRKKNGPGFVLYLFGYKKRDLSA